MTLYVYPPLSVTVPAPVGGATEAKQDDIIAAVDGVETSLSLLRKWPYATHAVIEPSEDVTNTYFTYKTSGGATVGTITTNKTTGVITYSPDKVV
jgi:hypothetical protein